MTLQELLQRLEGVRASGGGHVAKCPAHPDDKPSLSITTGKNGGIVMHCHAGCTTEAIVSALGLKMSDLMPQQNDQKKERRLVATYDYQDANGEAIYCVRRYDPKDFRQGKYVGGKFVANMAGVKRVPFRLPQILAAAKAGRPVFVVEGEKDVLTAERLGAVATCNAGGAGKWQDEWCDYFKGVREVYVIADNDCKEKNYPGQRHAVKVCKAMAAAGIKATPFVMPEGKDLTEWADRGHGKRDLAAVVRNPPPWPKEYEFDGEPQDQGFEIQTLADFPPYTPEELNPNILIKGGWLARGGSAFWISTAGTGKSIASVQLAMCMTEGRPFAGLTPLRPLRFWIVESEDLPDRVTLDREGIVEELTETMPDVDWRETTKKVHFVKFPSKIGAEFIDALDAALESAGEKRPDVLIINPLMAYVGGPVSDSNYASPFLRGGEINRKRTCGLQDVLERHGIGVIIFHHTTKPPAEKELDAWMNSQFPEYQGAGSFDITGWGRSFVMMMRVKGHFNMVCLTAGKNGNDIGWEEINGARRKYMAWSNGIGVDGRGRHGWRDLTDEEYEDVTKSARDTLAQDVQTIAETLKATPSTYNTVGLCGLTNAKFRSAWKALTNECTKHGLTCVEVRTGKNKHLVYGFRDAALAEADGIQRRWNAAQEANGRPKDFSKITIVKEPTDGLTRTDTNCTSDRRLTDGLDDISPLRGDISASVGSSARVSASENANQLTNGADEDEPDWPDDYEGEF